MRFELTQVVKILLIINIGVFILDSMLGGQVSSFLSLKYFGASSFYPYQFITYMFAHADFGHLLGNMFGLFIFGPLLERFLGSKRFVLLYFITGLGAALIHTGVSYWEINSIVTAVQKYIQDPSADYFYSLVYDEIPMAANQWSGFMENFEKNPTNPQLISESISRAKEISRFYVEETQMLGASGAVMGIVMTFALLFPNTELFLLFIPFPIKAKYFALMYIAYEIFSIIQDRPGDNVAHFAHLGGMIFAFFLVEYWKRRRDTFY